MVPAGLGEVDPKEVGHNIYILAHQLARHSRELAELLEPNTQRNPMAKLALSYYQKNTAQIEVSDVSLKLITHVLLLQLKQPKGY